MCNVLQERDVSLARQRELMSEVSELKSRLDKMKTNHCDLRLKATTSPVIEVTKSGVEALNTTYHDLGLKATSSPVSGVTKRGFEAKEDAMETINRDLRLTAISSPVSEVTKSGVEGDEDEVSRVLKEKLAAMLSDEFVTVAPRQHSILKHLRLLIDRVHSHNMVCISLSLSFFSLLL